jgi:broad specificity phosphatase PhoE
MKPRRIILVRHGESMGNIDTNYYYTHPDHSVPLTEKGIIQARETGKKLKEIIGEESVMVYSSPYTRTRQTRDFILESFNPKNIEQREDPRLREHEWAACLQTEGKLERKEEARDYGVFYYRFDRGESCADVYDRLSTFLGTMHRDFEKILFPDNVIICGHGMTNRIFLMRWFHWSVEYFSSIRNPRNCQCYILERNEDDKYEFVNKHEMGIRP